MPGVYLSGTGNTKHCIEKLVSLLDENAECIPLEDENAAEKIRQNDVIYLGYPTQFSNSPYMVRDFIRSDPSLWRGKKVFCVATMGAFSGDGARPSERKPEWIMAIHADRTLSYVGFIGHMAFGAASPGLLRVDYRRYIAGEDDRFDPPKSGLRTGR